MSRAKSFHAAHFHAAKIRRRRKPVRRRAGVRARAGSIIGEASAGGNSTRPRAASGKITSVNLHG